MKQRYFYFSLPLVNQLPLPQCRPESYINFGMLVSSFKAEMKFKIVWHHLKRNRNHLLGKIQPCQGKICIIVTATVISLC